MIPTAGDVLTATASDAYFTDVSVSGAATSDHPYKDSAASAFALLCLIGMGSSSYCDQSGRA